MEWEFLLQEKSVPKLENPVFIEGLPGIGNVGKIVVDFIIEKTKATKLYTIKSFLLPHLVFINEKNLVELPKIEIYYKKFRNKRDLVLLTGDAQPIDERSCYSFCTKVLEHVSKLGCKEIITLGGVGLAHMPKQPKVYITGNSKKMIKRYLSEGTSNELYGAVGPIVGVTGLMVGLAGKIDAISILGETSANPLYVGINASKKILEIQKLHNLFEMF